MGDNNDKRRTHHHLYRGGKMTLELLDLLLSVAFLIWIVALIVRAFYKWIAHEKRHDEKVKDEYQNSPEYKA